MGNARDWSLCMNAYVKLVLLRFEHEYKCDPIHYVHIMEKSDNIWVIPIYTHTHTHKHDFFHSHQQEIYQLSIT